MAIVLQANSTKREWLTVRVLGVSIFFGRYARNLTVVDTMRPIAVRLDLSHEKLPYVVDSLASPANRRSTAYAKMRRGSRIVA